MKKAKINIGWKEWVSFPDLDIPHIKAKIDTGAATSALHAEDITPITSEDGEFVSFTIQPFHDESDHSTKCLMPVHDKREIRSSNGVKEWRYVIQTTMKIGPVEKIIELTLTNRHLMRFNVLLGRQALRKFAIIEPGKSYLLGNEEEK